MRPAIVLHLLLASLLIPSLGQAVGQDSPSDQYDRNIQTWRTEHEAFLKSDKGWLAVVGLYWLREGQNKFGSDPGNDFVLPDSAPKFAGSFHFRKGQTKLYVPEGTPLKINGETAQTHDMPIDSLAVESNTSETIMLDRMSLQLIKRGSRYGIRFRNPMDPNVVDFAGEKWYPVDKKFRVEAKFARYLDEKTIAVTNILGDKRDSKLLGFVEFELQGKQFRLDAEFESESELLFNFTDPTNRDETYAAGRFLIVPIPDGDEITLDFNKAHNAPCAFSNYTTCPLPPKQNHIDIRIEAGEKRPAGY